LYYFISNDRAKASDILMADLKVFRSKSEALFKDLTNLLTIDNIRYDSIFILCDEVRIESFFMYITLFLT